MNNWHISFLSKSSSDLKYELMKKNDPLNRVPALLLVWVWIFLNEAAYCTSVIPRYRHITDFDDFTGVVNMSRHMEGYLFMYNFKELRVRPMFSRKLRHLSSISILERIGWSWKYSIVVCDSVIDLIKFMLRLYMRMPWKSSSSVLATEADLDADNGIVPAVAVAIAVAVEWPCLPCCNEAILQHLLLLLVLGLWRSIRMHMKHHERGGAAKARRSK